MIKKITIIWSLFNSLIFVAQPVNQNDSITKTAGSSFSKSIVENIDLIICNNNTQMFLTKQYLHDACPKGVKPILYVENFKRDYIKSIYIKPDSLVDISSTMDSKNRLIESLEKPFSCANGMRIYKHESLNFLNTIATNDQYCRLISTIRDNTQTINLKFKTPPVSQSYKNLEHFSNSLGALMIQNGMIALDISHHQGEIDWVTLSQITTPHKIELIIMKATEGGDYRDKTFMTNWIKAKEYGFLRGAYHFYRPETDPYTQAHNFIQQLGTLEQGDIVPIIDLEKPCANCSDLMGPHYDYMTNLKIFVERIKKHYHSKVLFYSGNNYYYDYLKGYFPDDYFWLARYSTDYIPHDFGGKTIGWQFTDKMRIPGIKSAVDVNFFIKSGIENLKIKK